MDIEQEFEKLIAYCNDKTNFDPKMLAILIKNYMRLHKVVYPNLDQ